MRADRRSLRYFDKIKQHTRKWVIAASAALTALATLAGVLNNWHTVHDEWTSWFARDNMAVVAIHARLIPFRNAAHVAGEDDQFSLQILLRNYGPPATLTAADITLAHTHKGGITGGAGGSCILSSDMNANVPVVLGSGEEKWVQISPMVYLPGLTAWLQSLNPDAVLPMTDIIGIHDLEFVTRLNKEMKRLYGDDAVVRVRLYTGVHERLRQLEFALTKGEDQFSIDGSLMHDALIGMWMAGNEGDAMRANCKSENAFVVGASSGNGSDLTSSE